MHARTLDLAGQKQGLKVLEDYRGRPDSHGVMETFTLALPGFDKGVHYRGGWWPAGGNRVYPELIDSSASVKEGGMFALLQLTDGGYLAILPIAGPIAYSWFDSEDGKLILKMGTHGKDPIEGSIPVCSWVRSKDPYEACYLAWKNALDCEQIKHAAAMRHEKEYPEPFEYLGWCSWEHFKNSISEQNMLQTMRDIEKSNLPIRFLLVDDGHFDRRSLAPNEKFPNGYKPLTDMRKPDKIKWVGIWYAFLGNSHGVAAPGQLGPVTAHTYRCNAGRLLPLHSEKSARAFYNYMLDFAKKDDIDFLKVDFQTDALPFYAGTPHGNPLRGLPEDNSNAIGNPLAAATNLATVFQEVVHERMNGLINCNWHNAVSLFNSGPSVVGRCSEDYSVGKLGPAQNHLWHSYSAMPWLGQIAWGDHDMFHSNDKFAGRMMAVSKAMSGAPVYLSDPPTEFVAEAIRPLCDDDGRLLRPLAPAAPVPEDLFYEPGQSRLYRVVAPLANKTAAIVVYNLDGGVTDDEQTLTTTITPAHYAAASAMIQPYPGPWPIGNQGLLVYDCYNKTAQPLADGYKVAIKGFGDRLLQISPIAHNWSVIGQTNKYLPAAAVEILSITPTQLKIRITESGPLTIYSPQSPPKAENTTFKQTTRNLYTANLTPKNKNQTVIIYRENN